MTDKPVDADCDRPAPSFSSALLEQVASVLDQPWRAHARCAYADPEMFFPDQGSTGDGAKRLCQECPVLDDCYRYALANDEDYGVWGGATARERRRDQRERREIQRRPPT